MDSKPKKTRRRDKLQVSEMQRLHATLADGKVPPKNTVSNERWFQRRINRAEIPREVQDVAMVYGRKYYRSFNKHYMSKEEDRKAKKYAEALLSLAKARAGIPGKLCLDFHPEGSYLTWLYPVALADYTMRPKMRKCHPVPPNFGSQDTLLALLPLKVPEKPKKRDPRDKLREWREAHGPKDMGVETDPFRCPHCAMEIGAGVFEEKVVDAFVDETDEFVMEQATGDSVGGPTQRAVGVMDIPEGKKANKKKQKPSSKTF